MRSPKNRSRLVMVLTLAAASVMAWPISNLGADPTGSVRGTVKVAHAPAASPPLPVKNAPQCGQSVPNEEVAVGAGGVLANAVVWLEGLQAPAGMASRNVTLDQRGCRFAPHVASATVGDQIALTSRDPVLHNVHANLGTRMLFNVAIPMPGVAVRKPLSRAGHVEILCDVHSWMSAHVQVFPHPYHAVTGADGTFQIAHVPPGTYPVKIWHERLGERSASATVAAGAATVDFTF